MHTCGGIMRDGRPLGSAHCFPVGTGGGPATSRNPGEKEPSPGLVTGLVCPRREDREVKGFELPFVYKKYKRGLGIYPTETLFICPGSGHAEALN